MLRENFDHGFDKHSWNQAKGHARNILVERAKRERPISYSELVADIHEIDLGAFDDRLYHFLGEIGHAEAVDGRGILTAFVVHKSNDKSPGGGFYELAKSLGRTFSDRDKFWIEEMGRVTAYWRQIQVEETRPPPTEFERLPIAIAPYPGTHPFSRSKPKFYRQLGDTAEGDSDRTRFFERVLLGIYWVIGRPVPYAFITEDGEVRSLDAGCIKFLLNRPEPRIVIRTNVDGWIVSVEPKAALVMAYRHSREQLISAVKGEAPLVPFDLNLDAPVDERQVEESKRVIRDGQETFRTNVLAAWRGRCAITNSAIIQVLDAAHIFRYLGPKTNDVRNGIPLRADIHRLFDHHLLTIELDAEGAKVRVSKTLSGTRYGKFAGKAITLPVSSSLRPDSRVLNHHKQQFIDAEKIR